MPEICEHKFVFLRSYDVEVGFHNWEKVDVYFCEKCLEYKEIQKPFPKGRYA
jgi:hypothetical protein